MVWRLSLAARQGFAYFSLTYGHRQGINSFAGDTHYPYAVDLDFRQLRRQRLDAAAGKFSAISIGPAQRQQRRDQSGYRFAEALFANELALQDSLYRDTLFRVGHRHHQLAQCLRLSVNYEGYTPLVGATASDAYIGTERDLGSRDGRNHQFFGLTVGYYTRQVLHEDTAVFQVGVSRLLTDLSNT